MDEVIRSDGFPPKLWKMGFGQEKEIPVSVVRVYEWMMMMYMYTGRVVLVVDCDGTPHILDDKSKLKSKSIL